MVKSIHKPVLLQESIDLLNVTSGTYVDCTLGGGGHSLEISSKLAARGGKVIGFDLDLEAIDRFEKLLKKEGWKKQGKLFQKGKVEIGLVRGNFSELKAGLESIGVSKVNGIIVDLGLSSDQIEDASRGFSYMKDCPLDMRMDRKLSVTAADLVNGLYESELIKLFKESDEKFAKRIAKAIVYSRKLRPIKTTLHLKQIIQKALPSSQRWGLRQASLPFPNIGKARLPFEQEGRNYHQSDSLGGKTDDNKQASCQLLRRENKAYWIKPAMRVFQALRIAVNSELSSLHHLLPQALEALAADSRFVIISYHSGEDRIVKNFFKEHERLSKIEILTKKPIRPSQEEIENNIRARSAKLRAFKKK